MSGKEAKMIDTYSKVEEQLLQFNQEIGMPSLPNQSLHFESFTSSSNVKSFCAFQNENILNPSPKLNLSLEECQEEMKPVSQNSTKQTLNALKIQENLHCLNISELHKITSMNQTDFNKHQTFSRAISKARENDSFDCLIDEISTLGEETGSDSEWKVNQSQSPLTSGVEQQSEKFNLFESHHPPEYLRLAFDMDDYPIKQIEMEEKLQVGQQFSVQSEEEEDDNGYNANLEVVGMRESFEEGELLNFMASQRIHYYKMEDMNEILCEQSKSFEQHSDHLRNIIMTMSNNYGGLIMFGLGKNKLVQGVSLSENQRQEFVRLVINLKNSIHNSKELNCNVSFFPIFKRMQAENSSPQKDIQWSYENCFQSKERDQSLLNQQQKINCFYEDVDHEINCLQEEIQTSFSHQIEDRSLLFLNSDNQFEQQLLFRPFCINSISKQEEWSISQGGKKKCINWLQDRFIIRIFVSQGQKLDATYVHIKNKEISSAIYDKKLKIFKQIYGEPLLNKIISKAQYPSLKGQRIILAEPDSEGLLVSTNSQSSHNSVVREIISIRPNSCIRENETDSSQERLKEGLNQPLSQEVIKLKRGQKIINDSKKRLTREKNTRYQTTARKTQSTSSNQSTIQLPNEEEEQYKVIELVGFEHSGNAKTFRSVLEKSLGSCIVNCAISKYDTLSFKLSQPRFGVECSGSEKDWMNKVGCFLLRENEWKNLITKEKMFKKLIINRREYNCDEGNTWVCFQNVRNKQQFLSQIAFLENSSAIERVNFYHQYVFKVHKHHELNKFCESNRQFQQSFLTDTVKKGYSSSKIILKNLKNSTFAQESLKNLLADYNHIIASQGTSFFICEFKTPLDSFLAFERLVNHRKQKFILDIFSSNTLDAFIDIQDLQRND